MWEGAAACFELAMAMVRIIPDGMNPYQTTKGQEFGRLAGGTRTNRIAGSEHAALRHFGRRNGVRMRRLGDGDGKQTIVDLVNRWKRGSYQSVNECVET